MAEKKTTETTGTDEAAKASADSAREKALAEREASIRSMEEQLANKAAELEKREAAAAAGPPSQGDRAAELDEKAKALAELEQSLAIREAKLRAGGEGAQSQAFSSVLDDIAKGTLVGRSYKVEVVSGDLKGEVGVYDSCLDESDAAARFYREHPAAMRKGCRLSTTPVSADEKQRIDWYAESLRQDGRRKPFDPNKPADPVANPTPDQWEKARFAAAAKV